MNRPEFRPISAAIFVGAMTILAVSAVRAQESPNPQVTPRAPVATPPIPQLPPPAAPTAPGAPNAGGQAGAAAEPGYLGVVTDDRQEKGTGVRVVELESGGPAEKGGLKTDDLITSINGKPVHGQSDMVPVLQNLAPGSKVTFAVDRGGQQQTVEITLGTRPPAGQRRFEKFGRIPEQLPEPSQGGGIGPDPSGAEPGRIPLNPEPGVGPISGVPTNPVRPNPPPNPPSPDTGLQLGSRILPPIEPSRRPLLGVKTRPVTEAIRQRLRLPTTNGALVVSRTLGSPAARAGIPLDSVITAVDGKPVVSPPDLTAMISQAGSGRVVELTYLFGGSERRIKVNLAEFAAGPGGLLGGGSVNAGPVPSPPAPQSEQFPVPDDKTRIDALERRVQQLEHRVDDLEQALRRSK